MDYLPLNCTLREPTASTLQELKSIPEEYTHTASNSWQQNSYLLILSKSLLYVLNSAGSELSAYIFNENSLEKITSYKLKKNTQVQSGDIGMSPPVMAADSREQKVFIFTS